MYEFVMLYVVSELGNMGEFQSAINLGEKVIQEDLRCKRVCILGVMLYENLWNEKEQTMNAGKFMNKEEMTERLQECISFSHFCKQLFYEKLYEKKLHQS